MGRCVIISVRNVYIYIYLFDVCESTTAASQMTVIKLPYTERYVIKKLSLPFLYADDDNDECVMEGNRWEGSTNIIIHAVSCRQCNRGYKGAHSRRYDKEKI